MFLILLQLDIFCTSAVNDNVIKTTIHSTRVACFLCTEVHGSKKNLPPSS